jgi:hypothetical protein
MPGSAQEQCLRRLTWTAVLLSAPEDGLRALMCDAFALQVSFHCVPHPLQNLSAVISPALKGPLQRREYNLGGRGILAARCQSLDQQGLISD